jgi:putative iron-dependent peroxidase
MATPQPAILTPMGEHQWYVHLSRNDGADLGAIKSVLKDLRASCAEQGINLCLGFGPTLLKDLTNDLPSDFQPFETIQSTDGSGKQAIGTQEELLFWMHSPHKDRNWRTQFVARQALKPHMRVARETITFIYGNSLDMTGFIDGTGNPIAEREAEVAFVADGQPGAGGTFINAQRWVHDLESWEKLPIEEQERIFGRKKVDSARLPQQAEYSHLSHVELREGKTGDDSTPKRDELVRRSTPYALHTGDVGLYFIAFCKTQAPLRERLRAMYGADGGVRDRLTDFSNPASGSFYFAPSVETLNAALG